MTKVIAVMGEPGAGKTTLMRKVMSDLGIGEEHVFTDVKLVPYHKKDNIYVLGTYMNGEVFAGTDRMSMAVQPHAIKFLETLDKEDIVLFEGDRLCTASFLEDCIEKGYDVKIVYLQTDRDVRKERFEERNSNQNETWLAGRESKVGNILTNFALMFNIEKLPNNNLDQQEIAVDFIKNLI